MICDACDTCDACDAAKVAQGVGPRQLGCGLKGGGEKLAHVVRATAEARPMDAWVALDMSNAFGQLRRDGALAAAAQVVPRCAPCLEMFLARRTKYRFVRAAGDAALPQQVPTRWGRSLMTL